MSAVYYTGDVRLGDHIVLEFPFDSGLQKVEMIMQDIPEYRYLMASWKQGVEVTLIYREPPDEPGIYHLVDTRENSKEYTDEGLPVFFSYDGKYWREVHTGKEQAPMGKFLARYGYHLEKVLEYETY